MLSCNSLTSSLFKCRFPAVVGEGMTPPQRILFPPEKIRMEWQQRQRAGAGLHNLGNTCFLNSALQCLTYTPPLANYLLSREHSQSCRQQGFCVMCRMERHVIEVLQSSGSAIEPWAIVSVLTRIGEHFKLGMQDDAHDFLCCTIAAMQEACLSGSSNLDVASQSTTVVHQIFAGFLRSRVTCLSCNTVYDYYEAFLDVTLDIKVRGFGTVLRDVPSPCIFPESMRLTLRARDLGGGWGVEGTVSFWGGHGSGVPVGAGFKPHKHTFSAPLMDCPPSSLCPPSTPV
ncbi:ubiquitin carboxyl-terminal hydrolase 36-like [Athene noctua]|uniref:ubiquitin carboxyl-terminal hydrolase 36-like n=1 Tax=Athene noctua TaxID=126797 RepID=UPI003EBB9B2F